MLFPKHSLHPLFKLFVNLSTRLSERIVSLSALSISAPLLRNDAQLTLDDVAILLKHFPLWLDQQQKAFKEPPIFLP